MSEVTQVTKHMHTVDYFYLPIVFKLIPNSFLSRDYISKVLIVVFSSCVWIEVCMTISPIMCGITLTDEFCLTTLRIFVSCNFPHIHFEHCIRYSPSNPNRSKLHSLTPFIPSLYLNLRKVVIQRHWQRC